MREIELTDECLQFIQDLAPRPKTKLLQLLEVISGVREVHSLFVKKLTNTRFYELRIKAGNEYRILIYPVDHPNFIECRQAVGLTGFMKKSVKDYKKAIARSEILLQNYLDEKGTRD